MTLDPRPPTHAWRLTLAVWLGAVTWVALHVPLPPGDDQAGFSLARATESLHWIAREPHPVGTDAHLALGARLGREFAALGLTVTTQNATFVDSRPGNRARLVQVRNVLARRRGLDTTGAILLMAHYDSAAGGSGAGDDGVGIAVLLETARALAAAPLRNDVIFAATDAEEIGLCGARVFLAEHPWARDLRVVLNFEARGTAGPPLLFETGDHDGWLVAQFARVAPAPTGSSLAPTLYEHMPNATDLTVFKDTGLPRLNFAFAEDWQSYHTARDTPERVAPASIRHEGLYALTLTRQLGGMDLSQVNADRARLVYFNLGPLLVRYDEQLALPLALLGLVATAGFVVQRWRLAARRLRDLVIGIAAPLVVVVIVVLVTRVVWGLLLRQSGDLRALWDQDRVYMPGFVLLTMVLAFVTDRLLRRVAGEAMVIGAIVWFALAGVVVALRLPGASYLFVWPLVATLILTWAADRVQDGARVWPRALLLGSSVAIVLLVLVPACWMAYLAMPTLPFVTVVPITWTCLLLTPCLPLLAPRLRWFLPAGVAVVAITLCGLSVAMANRVEVHQQRAAAGIYVVSADPPHATWISRDPTPVALQGRPVSQTETGAILASFPTWFGDWSPRVGLQMVNAPRLLLLSPAAAIEGDRQRGDTRTIELRLFSNRRAPELAACFRASHGISQASSGGRLLALTRSASSADPCDLIVTSIGRVDDGVPILVDLLATDALEAQIVDRSSDLDRVAGWGTGAIVMTRRYRWPAGSDQSIQQESR